MEFGGGGADLFDRVHVVREHLTGPIDSLTRSKAARGCESVGAENANGLHPSQHEMFE
jgi:hypothetical protein